MLQTFIDKQTAINKAIDRVKAKLTHFADYAAARPILSNADAEYLKDWNNWHDLQYRLEDRLTDNWSKYKDWHFETYNFNTY